MSRTYEDGYRDGESNVEADWIFALDEYCTLPDDVEIRPTQVAQYIARLQVVLDGHRNPEINSPAGAPSSNVDNG